MLYLTLLKLTQSHLDVRNTGPLSMQWETVCCGWDEFASWQMSKSSS